jgi:hypothetical protein
MSETGSDRAGDLTCIGEGQAIAGEAGELAESVGDGERYILDLAVGGRSLLSAGRTQPVEAGLMIGGGDPVPSLRLGETLRDRCEWFMRFHMV